MYKECQSDFYSEQHAKKCPNLRRLVLQVIEPKAEQDAVHEYVRVPEKINEKS